MKIEHTIPLTWTHDGHGGRGYFEGAGALGSVLVQMFSFIDSLEQAEGEMPLKLDLMRRVKIGTPCKLTLILEIGAGQEPM